MVLTPYQWSIERWHDLVEVGLLDGESVQLLAGEIIEMSPEEIEHSYTNRSVADYLRELLVGEAMISEAHPITLADSEPEPDIAIVRLPKTIYLQHHPYSEDIYWLVEVSNRTLNIDLGQKANIYASNGIPEYWVIDLVNQKLIVHTQPSDTQYQQIVEYTSGVVTPNAFPNIEIDLNQLIINNE